MCKTCGCSAPEKPVQYKCGDECACGIIEFDEEPKSIPYCCGAPMKRVK